MTKDRINEIRAEATNNIYSYVYSKQKELDALRDRLDEAHKLNDAKVTAKNLDDKLNVKPKIGQLQQLINELEEDSKKEIAEYTLKQREAAAVKAKMEALPIMKAYTDALTTAFNIATEFKGENVFKFRFSDVLGLDGNNLYPELSRLVNLAHIEQEHYKSFLEKHSKA